MSVVVLGLVVSSILYYLHQRKRSCKVKTRVAKVPRIEMNNIQFRPFCMVRWRLHEMLAFQLHLKRISTRKGVVYPPKVFHLTALPEQVVSNTTEDNNSPKHKVDASHTSKGIKSTDTIQPESNNQLENTNLLFGYENPNNTELLLLFDDF